MNKSVLVTNIQKIITNIEKTIEDLTSITVKDKSYSKNQIEKNINLLNVKIQNDESYRNVSFKSSNLELLIKKLQSERATLKKLISDTDFDIYSLNSQGEEKKSLKSDEQREYEILADSLNIAENDEEIYKIMKSKEVNIKALNTSIINVLREIEDKRKNIERYNEEIKMIDLKEQEYRSELEQLEEYYYEDQRKNKDIKKLNILNKLVSIISAIEQLDSTIITLKELIEYIGKREADMKSVEEIITDVKSKVAKLNGVILEYLASVDLEECFNEKETLINKLNDNDNYLINKDERRLRELEIANLQFDISFCQSECLTDEQNLIDYTHRIDKINDNINRLNLQNKMLQNQIDELNLKKTYFINENSNSQTDDISKEIKKKQRLIDSNKKYIEKLIKFKVDIENAIRSIKKTRKNSEIFKNDMEDILKDKKEFYKNNLTSKYNLDVDKKQLLLIDFIIEVTGLVKDILKQNYLKKLDELSVESLEPFIGVIGFYEYDKKTELLDETFIENVKKSMDNMISFGGISSKKANFIKSLDSQGIKVNRYGKSLKTIEDVEVVEKSVRLVA